MIEEVFRIVATSAIVGAVGLSLGLYLHIWRRHKVSNLSMALVYAIGGLTTEGKLTTFILHYESTVLLLMLAFLSKIVFAHDLLYKVLELAAGASLLICSVITMQNYRRLTRLKGVTAA